MSRAADRFEPVEGRALVPLPPFRLEDRAVEILVAGDAPTWVVIPAFDEVRSIEATLAAIEAQTLRPLVVCVVDNASRDGTPDVVRAWARGGAVRGPGLGVRLVHEPEKGTGAAADTGMRLAISAGASNLPGPIPDRDRDRPSTAGASPGTGMSGSTSAVRSCVRDMARLRCRDSAHRAAHGLAGS